MSTVFQWIAALMRIVPLVEIFVPVQKNIFTSKVKGNMKQQEIKTLKLMESLERNPKQTQRDLAKDLDISLGLVNAFTKRLIQKGFFKLKTIPKNRIKYILTPEGVCEKTKLTYQYILYSLDFYKETRGIIKSIFNQLSGQGKKRVFFIGANELTEIALISLKDSNLELASIIDDDRVGNQIMGVMIMHYSSLNDIAFDDVIIITKTDFDKENLRVKFPHVSQENVLDLSK
jgi:DNA-binding MarR family transcriptional regulator